MLAGRRVRPQPGLLGDRRVRLPRLAPCPRCSAATCSPTTARGRSGRSRATRAHGDQGAPAGHGVEHQLVRRECQRTSCTSSITAGRSTASTLTDRQWRVRRRRQAAATCWSATSTSSLTWSPTSQPPVSSATFQSRPQSLRLTLARAVNPARRVPSIAGEEAEELDVEVDRPGDVADRHVGGHHVVVAALRPDRGRDDADLGIRSRRRRSRPSAGGCRGRRSRCRGWPPTTISACDAGRIRSSSSTVPRTSLNVPRTVVTIMCLAENRTSVWAGSIANVAMGWGFLPGRSVGRRPAIG